MKKKEYTKDTSSQEYIGDEALKTKSSFFAKWEVVSTLPRSRGKEISLKSIPYKSRLD